PARSPAWRLLAPTIGRGRGAVRRRGERVNRAASGGRRGGGPVAHVPLDPVVGQHLALDLAGQVGVIDEELLGVVAALADALALVAEPGARFLDGAALAAEVDEVALVADALAVEDVELDLAERRRHLVLHHLHARAVTHHLLAVLERADATDVHADAGVELER